jgi:hypothetical protein
VISQTYSARGGVQGLLRPSAFAWAWSKQAKKEVLVLKGTAGSGIDAVVVLRMGRLAHLSTPQVIKCFHRIARDNGSSAYWIQGEGLVIVANPTEIDQNFPYHEWVLQAFLENAK